MRDGGRKESAHDGWELEVISYQDKRIRESQGSQTRRQGNLGSLVDDAIVETATNEYRAAVALVCKHINDLRALGLTCALTGR
jgi:hypothetical protein